MYFSIVCLLKGKPLFCLVDAIDYCGVSPALPRFPDVGLLAPILIHRLDCKVATATQSTPPCAYRLLFVRRWLAPPRLSLFCES